MGQEKKKIYILTNFSQYLKSYSPIIVVQGQIEMLLDHGYEPVLLTNKGWDPPESSIFHNVRNIQLTPVVIDGNQVDEQFERDVDTLYAELKAGVEPGSTVMTHDLIFLPDYVKLNVAARRLAEEDPSIHWLHWVHSATNPQDLIRERAMFAGQYAEHLASKFPNSLVCFPNAYDIPRVASNFGYEENEVVEVPHPTNPVEGMAPIVQRLYKAKNLYQPEVLMVYPIRLDRGKCVEALIWFMLGCKVNDVSSHVIICDFQSTGDDKVVYREELKAKASELGVADRVTFLSEFEGSAHMEVPHNVILDLFTLSNVFALPSKSETYSLIAQEALLRKNLCFLNQDFGPFRQIFGKGALYKQFFGANISIGGQNGEITTTYDNTGNHFGDIARATKYFLETNPVLYGNTHTRNYRNPGYIFTHYMEPLFSINEEIDDAEVLSDPTGIFGAGAYPGGSERADALPGPDGPAGD